MKAAKTAKYALPLILLAALLTACGSSGAPEAYDDGRKIRAEPYNREMSTVEFNFHEGCIPGIMERNEITTLVGAMIVCTCSYKDIREEVDFEDFKDINSELLEDLRLFGDRNSKDETVATIHKIIEDNIQDKSTTVSSCEINYPTPV